MKTLSTTARQSKNSKKELIGSLIKRNTTNNNFASMCLVCEAGNGSGNGNGF